MLVEPSEYVIPETRGRDWAGYKISSKIMTTLHLRELRMEFSRNFPLLPRSMRLPPVEIIPEKKSNELSSDSSGCVRRVSGRIEE
jgi:hypothetical protein